MSIARRFPRWFNAVLAVLAVAGAVALVLAAVVRLTSATWEGIADAGRDFGLTPRQGAGVVAVLALLVAAGAARARWSTRGPVTIHEVEDATGGSQDLCRQVTAILRDRLARAGVQPRGVVPSYAGVDAGSSDLVSSSPVNASGLVTKMLFSLLQFSTSSPGWWVDATIRRSERGEAGLTVVVQHVATGRHDLVETVWDETPQRAARRAAYVIAAWHLGRHARPSSRRRPAWRPSADALRHYEDAVFFTSRRRFDDALRSARAGLSADPSNLTLRRVLGETYERLGHWFSALHTYATGVVMLLDRDNGWSRTVLDGADADHPDRHWPRRRLARRRVRSDDAAGIVWRYVAGLTFADQWVDRWIADLERVAGEERRDDVLPGADPPKQTWDKGAGDVGIDKAIADLSARAEEQERLSRYEEARRMRGFFSRRYQDLLRAEFPMLNAAWFDETHDRRRSFAAVPGAAGGGPAASPGLRELIEHESARFPLREPRRPFRDPRRGPLAHPGWVADLARFFDHLQILEAKHPDAATGPGVPAGREPGDVGEVLAEAHARLGTAAGTTAFAEIAEAVRDAAKWEARIDRDGSGSLDRQLVASVASWAAHHLLRLSFRSTDNPGLGAYRPEAGHRALYTTISAQLDLRAFFQRAALHECDRLRRRCDLRRSRVAPAPLRRTLRLVARFHYLERLHQLRHTPEPTYDGPGGADDGRLARGPRERRGVDRVGLRLDTANAARRIASRRAAWWMAGGRPGEWNLWYYSACALSVVIQEPPVDDGPNGDRSRELSHWKRRNDPFADRAIRALNQSILVRRRGDVTAIDAGVTDWLLYEDPDLDCLRVHPRFQRWASATFGGAHVDQESSPVDRWQRARPGVLRDAEWRNEGAFGTERRWGRGPRRFWLANDHHLLTILTTFAPLVSARWLELAAGLDTWRPAVSPGADVRRMAADDEAAWRALALYRRFPAQPQLRLDLLTRLDALIGGARPGLGFPTSQEVLTGGAALDYSAADAVVRRGFSGATAALAEVVAAELDPLPPRAARERLADVARGAAARWQYLERWAALVEPTWDESDNAVAAPLPADPEGTGARGTATP